MAVDSDFTGQRSQCEVRKSGSHKYKMDPYENLVVYTEKESDNLRERRKG